MNSNGIMDLRKRLSKNLKRLIANPVIEAKELAAFDLIMNRRQFLKAAQFTAIGALVASACPPTAWGRYDRKLHVDPRDVGLSAGEQASVNIATQLVSGTELFQDTIYAQPVVAPEGFESHGLVEGAKGWSRLQSDLSSTNPDESQFLDTGYHFGPPELIQIEQDSSGKWEVVHYRRPWTAPTSSVRTSGLVRDIIMTQADGLDSPEKVIPVTGTFTNYFVSAGSDQQSYMTYLVFIQQSSGNHYIAIGTGLLKVSPPYDTLPDYPVQWVSRPLSDFGPKSSDTLNYTDKYTESVWQSDLDAGNPDALAQYDPRQSHEHILLYYDDKIIILSILDSGGKDKPNLTVSKLPYPGSTDDARVVHIDWDYNDVDEVDNWRALKTVAVARSSTDSAGTASYFCYAMQRGGPTSGGKDVNTFSTGITWVKVDYDNKWKIQDQLDVPLSDLQNGDLYVDYSQMFSANGLYSLVFGGYTYHAKLANFSGRGIFALTILESTDKDGDPVFELFGHFPLAFPDTNGLGAINTFFGGTSKFGGLRFVACDADGNLFLMRQQSAQSTSTPYAPPIYGLYDADGTPVSVIDAENDPLPPGTASTSNLRDLDSWVRASTPAGITTNSLEYSYNMLLQTALAFGTDSNNLAQAVWLGNGYQAAYAAKRFGLDSEHVVVRQIQSDGTDIYSSIAMFKNPVDKTWRQRVIASQTLPTDPGENETGDHYQATITPANVYGNAVSLSDAPNTNLRIEVRADSPCTVTDDTHNLYYDVDRYTSFLATPDPASGQLRLVVKADVFSQVLYVRLVDSSTLQRSTDSAMLNALSGEIYPWQSLNLAAQAQQRMGNDGTTSSQPGDGAPLVDTTVYISADTLSQSNQQNQWQTKGGYDPTTDNLTSLGSYLNTSGQNLISATGQLSLGAAADGVTIDPLYAVTAVPSDPTRNTVTTQFAYDSGTVTTTTSAPSAAFRRFRGRTGAPGSAFGSVSHALHDALHWLQHAEAKFYNDLSSGGVSIASAAEGITVTIGKDIMKQVNGVEQELNEVVTTVEEYASIVVNVVVTIVEESFIYQFIELLIALISLFLYFGDILDLSKSLKSLIEGLPDPSSTIPLAPVDTNYPWQDKLTGYVGSPNDVESDMNEANIDSVVDEVVDGVLNAVMKNPLTRKLMDAVASAISRAISELDTTSPVQFGDLTIPIVDTQIQYMETFSADIGSLFDNVTDDAVNFLIDQVIEDVENPQQTFTNLASGLGQFMAQVDADAMAAVYTELGNLVATDTSLIHDMMTQSDFLELHIPLLADLFRLFGIGDVSGNKVSIGSGDAISFTLALVIWTGIYMATGKSINNINDLIPASPTALGEPLLGASTNDKLTFANAVVSAGMATINGAIWSFMQTVDPDERRTNLLYRNLDILGAFTNLCRWDMASGTMSIQAATGQVSWTWTQGYLPVFTYCRFVTAVLNHAFKVRATAISPIVILAINFSLNLLAIVWSIIDAKQSEPQGADWAVLVGNDVGRANVFGKLLYASLYGSNPQAGVDSLPTFGFYVVGTSFAGFGAAAAATGVQKLNATAPPDAIKQLLYQVDALNIKLQKRAKYRVKTRLIRDLRRALLAYAQGDLQNSVFYLVKARRTVESLKYGGRITSSVADILITQIQNILAYIGIKGGKISKGGLSLIGSLAYGRRRR